MAEDAAEANPDNHERDDDEQLRKLHRELSERLCHRGPEGPHYLGGVAGGVAGAAGAGASGAGAAGAGALCCAGFAGAGGGAELLSTDPGPR
jgi:hypothetical protein